MTTPRSLMPDVVVDQTIDELRIRLSVQPQMPPKRWVAEVRDHCGDVCATIHKVSFDDCDAIVNVRGVAAMLAEGVYDIVLVDPDCQDCASARLHAVKDMNSAATATAAPDPVDVTSAGLPSRPEKIAAFLEPWADGSMTACADLVRGATVLNVEQALGAGPFPAPVDFLVSDGVRSACVRALSATETTLTIEPAAIDATITAPATVTLKWTPHNISLISEGL